MCAHKQTHAWPDLRVLFLSASLSGPAHSCSGGLASLHSQTKRWEWEAILLWSGLTVKVSLRGHNKFMHTCVWETVVNYPWPKVCGLKRLAKRAFENLSIYVSLFLRNCMCVCVGVVCCRQTQKGSNKHGSVPSKTALPQPFKSVERTHTAQWEYTPTYLHTYTHTHYLLYLHFSVGV